MSSLLPSKTKQPKVKQNKIINDGVVAIAFLPCMLENLSPYLEVEKNKRKETFTVARPPQVAVRGAPCTKKAKKKQGKQSKWAPDRLLTHPNRPLTPSVVPTPTL